MPKFLKYAALLLVAGVLLITVAIVLPLPASPLPARPVTHYALTNANVVDTGTGGVATDQTVVIENGRIVSILPTGAEAN